MTTGALISVVIAVRDGGRYLERSLESVLQQHGPAFDVVVVDDGSTDGTGAILDGLARADPRVTVVHTPPRGFTAALSDAIARSSGAYLARHDADDVSLPGRFAQQARFLDDHPDVAAVGAAAEIIDEDERLIGPFRQAHGVAAVRAGLLTLRETPVHGAMMVRRSALDAVGGYRAGFLAAQDYDLWLRLSERFSMDVLTSLLYRWRLSGSGVYSRRRAEQLQYAGVARTFATERQRFGDDSYGALVESGGDFERFAENYRLAGPLYALWGELLYRATNDSAIARRHLGRALRCGHRDPRTVALFAWATLRLRWPGGRPLGASSGR